MESRFQLSKYIWKTSKKCFVLIRQLANYMSPNEAIVRLKVYKYILVQHARPHFHNFNQQLNTVSQKNEWKDLDFLRLKS